MKQTLFTGCIWLLLCLAFAPAGVQAQTAGTAFSCDGTFYQIRQVAVGTANHSQLFRVNRNVTPAADPTTTVYNTTLVLDLATGLGLPATANFVVNSLAYNPQDGYLYALTYPVNNTGFPVVNLYKIGTGVEDLGAITVNGAAPAATPANPGGYPQLAAGVIDNNGFYYASPRNLADGSNKNNLYRFDLKQATNAAKRNAVTVPMDFYTTASPNTVVPAASVQDFSFIDLGFNPADNLLYGIYSIGSVYRFDFTTTPGRARVTRIGTPPATAPNFGSVSFDLAGNLFAYSNEGNFYSVNVATGAATDIGDVPTAAVTDGASCTNPSQRVDVVKEVTRVALVSGTTYDVDFIIRVKNTGTVTATNVQISDFLRGAASNTTFPTSTSLTIPAISIAANGTALQFNPAYTGQGNNGDLLTGDQALTAGQSAAISFTARVVFPAGGVPTTAQNNSAYVSSISGATTNPGYSLQGTNGVLVVPPGDLIATDVSTNSAALPNTPNGDTPLPSPVFFTAAILGNVFEDANYGGGTGRSQAISQGSGVPAGTRVELYDNNVGLTLGRLIAAVDTDAEGNYGFVSGQNGVPTLAGGGSYTVRVLSNDVASNRPLIASAGAPVAVQTFVSNGQTDDGNRVGGENPLRQEAAAGTTPGAAGTLLLSLTPLTGNTAAQSLSTVTLPAAGPRLGVDFGFNFSTIVNTNDAGQGSLRQFILNSNALTNAGLDQVAFNNNGTALGADPAAGVETSIFMIADGRTTGVPAGLRAGVNGGFVGTTATVTLATALPTITDSNTALDGSKQTTATGNNVAAVAETTTGPEVVINFNAQAGLLVTGGNTRVASLGLNNANSIATNNQGRSGLTFSSAGASGSTVTDVTASGNSRTAIRVEGGVANVTVSNNVLINNDNGATVSDADGLQLLGTTNANVSGNTISGNKGYGIFMTNANNTGATVSNNIIRNNGSGTSTADAGISVGLQSDNNLFLGNTITGNAGDGIVALAGAQGNRFSQNNISANGGLGIDLSATATVTGDNVSLNADGKTAASGANGLLNFPVFTQATINNGRLFVTGYARAGALVELFVASADASRFGEGSTYLFTATEGSTDDIDPRLSSYNATTGTPAGSPNQGAENGVSNFQFSFPVTAAQITALVNNQLTATASVPVASASGLLVGNTSEFAAFIAVRNNQPLPVELAVFTATAAKLDARLAWRTASEKNNAYFDVERSLNGTDFVKIGQVKGQGTSSAPTDYALTDAGIGAKATGLVYYRLRQVDFDGTASFSPVRTVAFANTAAVPAIGVYPNPATASTQLDLTQLPAGTYQVSILDATGRVVLNTSLSAGAVRPLKLNTIASGTYTVLVRGQNNGQVVNLARRLVKE